MTGEFEATPSHELAEHWAVWIPRPVVGLVEVLQAPERLSGLFAFAEQDLIFEPFI